MSLSRLVAQLQSLPAYALREYPDLGYIARLIICGTLATPTVVPQWCE